MFFVTALVICLIIKFRFPKGKSIASIIKGLCTVQAFHRIIIKGLCYYYRLMLLLKDYVLYRHFIGLLLNAYVIIKGLCYYYY